MDSNGYVRATACFFPVIHYFFKVPLIGLLHIALYIV